MAIKAGNVGATGATGALLDRSLIGMRNLVDRSLAGRADHSGMPTRTRLISLADFRRSREISGALEAVAGSGCVFTIELPRQVLAQTSQV